MKNIEAVIFDLGGVILNIDYNLTRAAFEKAGVHNFDEMYSQSNADDLFSKLETGTISEENFYEQIVKRTAIDISPDLIKKSWNAMLLTFREESLDFLEKIKDKYRLFLLSNTNHIHLKELKNIFNKKNRRNSFESYFEKAYYSCDINLRKPDVEIFEWILKENNLAAEKTIFIDDSVQNIEAAKQAGLQTILLKPGMLIEDLDL